MNVSRIAVAVIAAVVACSEASGGAGRAGVKTAYGHGGRRLLAVQYVGADERLAVDRPLWYVTTEGHGPISAEAFTLTAEPGQFVHQKSGLLCSVTATSGANFVRHFFTLTATKPVLVESFSALTVPGAFKPGGKVLGSPLVYGNWFAGMEHPTAHTVDNLSGALGGNGDSELSQYAECRGRLEAGERMTYSSVIGHGVSGSLRRGLLEYIEASRARRYQPFLHYNSWYDICDQGSDGTHVMDSPQCLEVMKAWQRDFMEPYRIKMDSFVFDDGWDDYENLWSFHRERFPKGFAPQAELAGEIGTSVGTWFSPFGGYGGTGNARKLAARKAGYRVDGDGIRLSDKNYYKLLHEKSAEMISRYNVNYFKYDGVGSGSVADMDAACRLMAELRQLKPDLYINLTTGTWGSPFFLLHGDSIWRGGSDALTWGDEGPMTHRLMNYRDGNVYNNIVQQSPLFPLNSLMLCGMVYSRLGLGRTSVDQTDKSFADQACVR